MPPSLILLLCLLVWTTFTYKVINPFLSASTFPFHILNLCFNGIALYGLIISYYFGLFCIAIKRDSISPLRFLCLSHVQVVSLAISPVCHLRYPYGCCLLLLLLLFNLNFDFWFLTILHQDFPQDFGWKKILILCIHIFCCIFLVIFFCHIDSTLLERWAVLQGVSFCISYISELLAILLTC